MTNSVQHRLSANSKIHIKNPSKTVSSEPSNDKFLSKIPRSTLHSSLNRHPSDSENSTLNYKLSKITSHLDSLHISRPSSQPSCPRNNSRLRPALNRLPSRNFTSPTTSSHLTSPSTNLETSIRPVITTKSTDNDNNNDPYFLFHPEADCTATRADFLPSSSKHGNLPLLTSPLLGYSSHNYRHRRSKNASSPEFELYHDSDDDTRQNESPHHHQSSDQTILSSSISEKPSGQSFSDSCYMTMAPGLAILTPKPAAISCKPTSPTIGGFSSYSHIDNAFSKYVDPSNDSFSTSNFPSKWASFPSPTSSDDFNITSPRSQSTFVLEKSPAQMQSSVFDQSAFKISCQNQKQNLSVDTQTNSDDEDEFLNHDPQGYASAPISPFNPTGSCFLKENSSISKQIACIPKTNLSTSKANTPLVRPNSFLLKTNPPPSQPTSMPPLSTKRRIPPRPLPELPLNVPKQRGRHKSTLSDSIISTLSSSASPYSSPTQPLVVRKTRNDNITFFNRTKNINNRREIGPLKLKTQNKPTFDIHLPSNQPPVTIQPTTQRTQIMQTPGPVNSAKTSVTSQTLDTRFAPVSALPLSPALASGLLPAYDPPISNSKPRGRSFANGPYSPLLDSFVFQKDPVDPEDIVAEDAYTHSDRFDDAEENNDTNSYFGSFVKNIDNQAEPSTPLRSSSNNRFNARQDIPSSPPTPEPILLRKLNRLRKNSKDDSGYSDDSDGDIEKSIIPILRRSKRIKDREKDSRPRSPGRRCVPRHNQLVPLKSVLKQPFEYKETTKTECEKLPQSPVKRAIPGNSDNQKKAVLSNGKTASARDDNEQSKRRRTTPNTLQILATNGKYVSPSKHSSSQPPKKLGFYTFQDLHDFENTQTDNGVAAVKQNASSTAGINPTPESSCDSLVVLKSSPTCPEPKKQIKRKSSPPPGIFRQRSRAQQNLVDGNTNQSNNIIVDADNVNDDINVTTIHHNANNVNDDNSNVTTNTSGNHTPALSSDQLDTQKLSIRNTFQSVLLPSNLVVKPGDEPAAGPVESAQSSGSTFNPAISTPSPQSPSTRLHTRCTTPPCDNRNGLGNSGLLDKSSRKKVVWAHVLEW